MMGTKAKLNGTEEDAFYGWKRYYCYLTRPGVTKWIKKHFWRKQRAKYRSERGRQDDEST